jgi:hypothetical protein
MSVHFVRQLLLSQSRSRTKPVGAADCGATSWMVGCTLLPECTRKWSRAMVVGLGFSDNKG